MRSAFDATSSGHTDMFVAALHTGGGLLCAGPIRFDPF